MEGLQKKEGRSFGRTNWMILNSFGELNICLLAASGSDLTPALNILRSRTEKQ
jgi:hypothetical protein